MSTNAPFSTTECEATFIAVVVVSATISLALMSLEWSSTSKIVGASFLTLVQLLLTLQEQGSSQTFPYVFPDSGSFRLPYPEDLRYFLGE